ncbi:MAG: hypothetical protein RL078_117, partial [Bacteroidota bacterium]
MRFLLIFLCCISQLRAQNLAACNNDSLSPAEKQIAEQYPFIQVACNQFQFFSAD